MDNYKRLQEIEKEIKEHEDAIWSLKLERRNIKNNYGILGCENTSI